MFLTDQPGTRQKAAEPVPFIKRKPSLAVIRCNAMLAYRPASNQGFADGYDVQNVLIPKNITPDRFDRIVEELRHDRKIDGILLVHPLPPQIRDYGTV